MSPPREEVVLVTHPALVVAAFGLAMLVALAVAIAVLALVERRDAR
jgi:hypothetical protein